MHADERQQANVARGRAQTGRGPRDMEFLGVREKLEDLEARMLRTTRLGPSERRSLGTRPGGEDVRLQVS